MARAAALLALVGAASPAGPARAGDLKDLVRDLYGGDGILLARPSGPGFDHAPHFTAGSLEGLGTLNAGLAASFGFFSFNSTVTGFTFDLERGVPVRRAESHGPLIAERASTLGARKLDLALSYTRVSFTHYEGDRLSDLSMDFLHEDVNGDGRLGPPPPGFAFEQDVVRADLDVDLDEDVLTLFSTYGLTPRIDVGLIVPLIHIRARATANARVIDNGGGGIHEFDPAGESPRSVNDGDVSGVGDLLLRGKYNLVRDRPRWPELALVGQLELPTGDEDDLLGTGEVQYQLLLVASRSFGRIAPHVNLGYELVPAESELSNMRYALGFDAGLTQDLTGAVDLIGRWEPDGDGIGDHVIDAALGLKWNARGPWILSGNLILPLNRNEGLRARVIWTLGVERAF